MASCAEGLSLSELLGDELFEDYLNETTSESSAITEFSNEDLERLTGNKNTTH